MLDAVGSAWQRAVRFARALAGEDRYEIYVAHEQRAHPGREVMSERAFWRMRSDDQGRNPEGRCC